MSSAPRQGSAPRCPVAHGVEFDPLSVAAAADPMPWLRVAQRGTPVFYLPGYDLWCVTRYDDVIEVLRDPGSYSSRKTISLAKLPPDLLAAFPDGPPDRVLVSLDPPEHTRLRQLAQKAFTPKLVDSRESEIRDLCDALIKVHERSGHDRELPGLGRGTAPEIMATLIESGYDGWWELEVFSNDGTYFDAFPDSYWSLPHEEFLARSKAAFDAAYASALRIIAGRKVARP